MTSKRLFANLCSENRKRRLWPAALSIAGNFFAQIVYAILMCGVYDRRLLSKLTIIGDVQNEYVTKIAGFANPCVLLIVCGLAFINALQGFSYLFDQRTSDLYGALPVKREKLFDAISLNGVILFVIPYIICHIFVMILGVSKGYLPVSRIPFCIGGALAIIICYCLVYVVCILASVMTGHVVVAALAVFVFMVAGPAIEYIIQCYMLKFMFSYYVSGNWPLNDYISPLWIIFKIANETTYNMKSTIPAAAVLPVVIAAVLAVVFYILCRYLIKKRPAEAAGKAISFKITKPFIKCIISVVVTLYFGLLFWEISESFLGFIFGIVCGLVITHAVIETIYEFDFKASFTHFDTLLISTGVVAIIVMIFLFDPFQYDTWIPRTDRVVTSAISTNYGTGNSYVPSWDGYGTRDVSGYQMKYMKLTDQNSLEPIAMAGARYTKAQRLKNIFDNYAYEYSTGDDDNKSFRSVNVRWDLKDGRSVYRRFSVDFSDKDIFSNFEKIFDSDEYKYGTFGLMNASADEFKSLNYSDLEGYHDLELKTEDREKLIEAYKKDILNQKLEQIKNEKPLIALNLTNPDLAREYSEDRYGIVVYPSYKNLLKFMEDNCISTDWKSGLDSTYNVKVSVYADMNNIEWETSDKEEIKALLDGSMPDSLAYNTFNDDNDATNYWMNVEAHSEYGISNIYLRITDIKKMPEGFRKAIEDYEKKYVDGASIKTGNTGWVSLVSNQ